MNKKLPRKTGHRPRREIQEIRAIEVAELRSMNQKLKRENARLRRQLEKYVTQIEESSDDEEVKTLEEADKPKKNDLFKCPNCNGTDCGDFNLGDKVFIICKTCKWRKIK